MTHEDQMFARLVKERSRQSRKTSKFQLDDDENDDATHKGKKLDPNKRGNWCDDQLDGSIDCLSGLVDDLFVFFFFVSSSSAPVAVGTTKCHAPKMLVERLATAHSQTAGGRSDFRIAIVGNISRYHHHHPNLYPSEQSNVHELEAAAASLQQNNSPISEMVKLLNNRIAVFEEDKLVLKTARR
jgi:hypothetical protein